jgi:hypothetical protein
MKLLWLYDCLFSMFDNIDMWYCLLDFYILSVPVADNFCTWYSTFIHCILIVLWFKYEEVLPLLM